jgi:hypothetical protein
MNTFLGFIYLPVWKSIIRWTFVEGSLFFRLETTLASGGQTILPDGPARPPTPASAASPPTVDAPATPTSSLRSASSMPSLTSPPWTPSPRATMLSLHRLLRRHPLPLDKASSVDLDFLSCCVFSLGGFTGGSLSI